VSQSPEVSDAKRARNTFQALEHPEFRRFWVAQSVSLIGTWLQGAAQAWLVLTLYPGNNALATQQLGFLSALQWTPSLVLSLFAGAVLDRVSRRNVLLTTQITLMLTAIALGLAVLMNRVSFELVAVIALISGLANVFDIVARQSLVPNLVPRASMTNAVALNSLSLNTARVLGGTLFGLLAPLVGLAPLFLLNAATFFGVIGAVLSLKPKDPEAHNENIFEDVRIGLRYVFQTPVVRGPILLLACLSLTVINFQVIIPTFAKFGLELAETGYGLLSSMFGLGSALGAFLSATRQTSNRDTRMAWGSVLLSVAVGVLAFAPNVVIASVALFAAGTGMILFTVNANSSVQLATPDRLRGRVMSVYTLVFAGMSPFGALLVGFLMSWFGARTGVALLAAAALVAVLALRPRVAGTLSAPSSERSG
jgi:MFS family permease